MFWPKTCCFHRRSLTNKRMNRFLGPLALLLSLLTITSFGQIRKNPLSWSATISPANAKVGDVVTLKITGRIDNGWYTYASGLDPNIGPIPTTVKLKPSDTYQPVGKLTDVGAHSEMDNVWGAVVTKFLDRAVITQKVKLLKPNPAISGTVEAQACSKIDGVCLPPAEADFSASVKTVAAVTAPAAATSATTSATAVAVATPVGPSVSAVVPAASPTGVVAKTAKEGPVAVIAPVAAASVATTAATESMSLGAFALAAFLSGLVALLTPCVFPIIPMTVSFFTHQKGGTWKALLYGFSIIAIYVLIGTLVSRINGPAFANFVSTHWLPNLLFFAVFFVFALSFLGLFEIVLPSSLVNRADAASERGGLGGIFFMAFTLVLVSFSCTGPIVGSILVASAGGEVVKPIIGMAAFASAFAIPFTLFAIFPQWLKTLPKSGGWLNSVKVVLGFLELALALKFLSIADQVYHWHLLDREIFLALWIVIFSLLGLYLLGKIRLPHDSEMKSVPVPRLLLAIATLTFVVYMIPGMWGAPLKALAGYLPPETTQDFNLNRPSSGNGASGVATAQPAVRHSDLFRLPHGLTGFFDYKEALAEAKRRNKPVFIDFTGHGCVNCREMEARVWSDPSVLTRLQNDFVVTALYVDDKTDLPEADWYTSKYDNRQKTSIGAQNADLQIVKFNNNAQPHYCIVSPDGKLLVTPKNYDLDVARFAAFLDSGKQAFGGI
jgi:thiol:disulfide interchange protein